MSSRPLLLVLGALVLCAPAFADPPARKQAERRIEQGAASGTLTAAEQKRLEKQRGHVEAMKRKANADGIVTDAERKQIQRAERKLSNRIYKQKHDRQGKPGKAAAPHPAVRHGAKDGSLTRKEARHLNRRANHVQNVKDQAASDNIITDRERRRIQKAEKGLNRDIKRKKTNKRERKKRR